ncbi:hypothetical protein RKD47_006735 [Streptomyces albogriseolus]
MPGHAYQASLHAVREKRGRCGQVRACQKLAGVLI